MHLFCTHNVHVSICARVAMFVACGVENSPFTETIQGLFQLVHLRHAFSQAQQRNQAFERNSKPNGKTNVNKIRSTTS